MGNKKDGSKKKKKEKLNPEFSPQINTTASQELAKQKSQELAKQKNKVPDFGKLYAESSHGDDYTINFNF